MNNKLIYTGGNSMESFSSSIVFADLYNRFGVACLDSSNFNYFFRSIFVEFNFKLPFNNILSKFKNRIHFLLYFLFFELLVSQKPKILVHRERLMDLALFKNKREIKKAKESIGIQSFSFNVSLLGKEQIGRFLTILSFFIAPFTDKRFNPPSKHVAFSLLGSLTDQSSSKSSVSFGCVIKNLSIFPGFGIIDDLSASGIELRIKVFLPTKMVALLPNRIFNKNVKQLGYFLGTSYGLTFGDSHSLFNLRFFKV